MLSCFQILSYVDNKGITYSYNVPTGMGMDMDKPEKIAPVIYIDGGKYLSNNLHIP